MAGLIDYSIVQPGLTNALIEQAKTRQMQQSAQERQNALLDLQLRAAQRGEEEALAQREAYKSQDPIKALYAGGFGAQAMALEKQRQEQRSAQLKQAEEELKIGRGIAERAFAAGRAASMSAPGTEKAAVLSVLNQYQGRGIDLAQDLSEIANLPDAQVLEHVFNKSQELKNLSEMITTDTGAAILRTPRFQQPGMPAQQPVGAFQGEPQQIMNQLATIADPAERAAATAAYQRQLTAQAPTAGTRIPKALSPAQELQEARAQRSLQLQEEKARQDADPQFQQRMEAARVLGRKAAEGDVAAVQALPKVINKAEEGLRLIDELVGKRDAKGQLLKGEKAHPGFESAVGATFIPGARFVPGTDAAGFMSRFEQIKGQAFLEAFESLRGGGAITQIEGEKATDAINRMSISTDEKEFVRAATDLKNIIQKGVETARSRAAQAGGVSDPAAPAATPNIDALLEKYQ
jgi:hypothetical protein